MNPFNPITALVARDHDPDEDIYVVAAVIAAMPPLDQHPVAIARLLTRGDTWSAVAAQRIEEYSDRNRELVSLADHLDDCDAHAALFESCPRVARWLVGCALPPISTHPDPRSDVWQSSRPALRSFREQIANGLAVL